MALDAAGSLIHKVSSFVAKSDYTLQSLSGLILDSSQDVSILMSSVIPVDPTDPGEMALANRGYVDRARLQALGCLAELSVASIKSLGDVVRAQGLMIKKLESNDLVLLSVAESIIQARSNTASTLADLGSSTLKGAASALWAVPGVNVAFGLAAYGGGIFLDWYRNKSNYSALKDDLSMARHLILDNAIPVAVYDGMDRVLLNRDLDDHPEVISDWITRTEQAIFEVEAQSFDSHLDRNDIIFVKRYDRGDIFGIMFIVVRESPIYVIGILDLSSNIISIFELPYRYAPISELVKNTLKHYMCGSDREGSIGIISRTPKMATDDILLDRLYQIRMQLPSIRGDVEERRSMVHALLQSGSA